MKELTMFVRPEKLETVKHILIDKHQCGGISISNVMGCGKQQGFTEEFRGTRTNVNLLPKMRIEVVVDDSIVETIIEDICKNLSTGHFGDGKIFIKPVEDAVRIRTGERGSNII